MATLFQQTIEQQEYYSARELREIVLSLFPPGLQAIKSEAPQQVRFRGLAFIDNSNPRCSFLNGFDQLYQMTQFGEQSREQVLEELIPHSWPARFGNWIRVVEMPPLLEDYSGISTTFDYDSFRHGYHVRK